jgi:hypothetical protein
MSELTYISATQVNTYTSIDALKVDIIKTVARWFPNNYVYNEDHPLDSWVQREGTELDILCNGTFQFELLQVDIRHVYELTMYGVGRYRRHGSSCDYFERVFDSLEQQLKHPSPPFATMLDAYQSSAYENRIYFGQYTSSSALPVPGAFAETVVYDEEDSVASLDEEDAAVLREDSYNERNGGYGGHLEADEIFFTTEDAGVLSDDDTFSEDSENDEDSVASLDLDEEEDLDEDLDEEEEDADDESEAEDLDEDELLMSMPLRDMTDNQIEEYTEMIGREPRDEINEWSMDYEGGPILRYSYVNFADETVSNQTVSDRIITRARFAGATLRNCVFEQVQFFECDFKSVVLENVTFTNSSFIDCELESYIVLHNSCTVENYDYEEDMARERLEDNVTYRFC